MLPKNCPCAVLFNLAILETRTINLLPFKNQTQILKRYKSITKKNITKHDKSKIDLNSQKVRSSISY